MGLINYLKEELKDNLKEAVTRDTELSDVQNVTPTPESTLDTTSASGKTDAEYFNIVNEETGFRYNIPMLDPGAPGYFYKYVNYMQFKERSPEQFEKMLNWE